MPSVILDLSTFLTAEGKAFRNMSFSVLKPYSQLASQYIENKISFCDVSERWFYLDVLACRVFAASQNVPGAPARGAQKQASRSCDEGIFGAQQVKLVV
jgi:hypothetical protein